MCYNCGCGMPQNDMGDANNITEQTFETAAKASGRSVEEVKKSTLEQLKKEAGE